MFSKTFLVALILCACYFGASSAMPQLPQLPLLSGNPVGKITEAFGSALGAVTGSFSSFLPGAGGASQGGASQGAASQG